MEYTPKAPGYFLAVRPVDVRERKGEGEWTKTGTSVGDNTDKRS